MTQLIYLTGELTLLLEAEPSNESTPITPPRVDGGFIGGISHAAIALPSSSKTDIGAVPLQGGGLRLGEMVYPWMYIGLEIGGAGSPFFLNSPLSIGFSSILIEGAFYPKPRYPFSVRVAMGFGGGIIRDEDNPPEPGTPPDGFGGAVFRSAFRYEFFPFSKKRKKGGGFSLGPEVAWTIAPPANPATSYVQTFSLGLASGFYFGR